MHSTDKREAEEWSIIKALRAAKDLKEHFQELADELRLEAENEIDLKRPRC